MVLFHCFLLRLIMLLLDPWWRSIFVWWDRHWSEFLNGWPLSSCSILCIRSNGGRKLFDSNQQHLFLSCPICIEWDHQLSYQTQYVRLLECYLCYRNCCERQRLRNCALSLEKVDWFLWLYWDCCDRWNFWDCFNRILSALLITLIPY